MFVLVLETNWLEEQFMLGCKQAQWWETMNLYFWLCRFQLSCSFPVLFKQYQCWPSWAPLWNQSWQSCVALEANSCWVANKHNDEKQWTCISGCVVFNWVVLFLSFSSSINVGRVELLSGIKVGKVVLLWKQLALEATSVARNNWCWFQTCPFSKQLLLVSNMHIDEKQWSFNWVVSWRRIRTSSVHLSVARRQNRIISFHLSVAHTGLIFSPRRRQISTSSYYSNAAPTPGLHQLFSFICCSQGLLSPAMCIVPPTPKTDYNQLVYSSVAFTHLWPPTQSFQNLQ
jgi:hypothetical protein